MDNIFILQSLQRFVSKKKKKRVFKDCSGKEKEIIIADAVTLEADINSEKNFPPKQDSNLLTGIAPHYFFFFFLSFLT